MNSSTGATKKFKHCIQPNYMYNTRRTENSSSVFTCCILLLNGTTFRQRSMEFVFTELLGEKRLQKRLFSYGKLPTARAVTCPSVICPGGKDPILS